MSLKTLYPMMYADKSARLIVMERENPLAEAQTEAPAGVGLLRCMVDHVDYPPVVLKSEGDRKIVEHRRSLGVVAAIMPWNVPLKPPLAKLVPASFVGNTVVAQTAATAPLAACLLAEIWSKILPSGVFNVAPTTRFAMSWRAWPTPPSSAMAWFRRPWTRCKTQRSTTRHSNTLTMRTRLVREEHFCLVPVFSYGDLDEALERANATERAVAVAVAMRIEAGTVLINEHLVPACTQDDVIYQRSDYT